MDLYTKEQINSFVRTAKVYHTCYFEILLALVCGLRTGEILGLKYSDFHKKSRTLTIQRQYTRIIITKVKDPTMTNRLKVYPSERPSNRRKP